MEQATFISRSATRRITTDRVGVAMGLALSLSQCRLSARRAAVAVRFDTVTLTFTRMRHAQTAAALELRDALCDMSGLTVVPREVVRGFWGSGGGGR